MEYKLKLFFDDLTLDVARKFNIPSLLPSPATITNIYSLSKTELECKCKELSFPVKGTKDELIQRLLTNNKDLKKQNKGRKVCGKTQRTEGGQKRGKKEIKKENIKDHILLNILKKSPTVHHIKRNKFGNFEHESTRFVFGKGDRRVIGKQTDNNHIIPLSLEDIEKCRDLKFDFILPENLNYGKKNIFSSTLKEELKGDDDDDYSAASEEDEEDSEDDEE